MYCSNCGQEINSSDNYCSKCGKNLSNISTTETENKSILDASVKPSNSTTNDKPKKNPWLYAILYIGAGLAIIGCIAAVLIPGLASGKTPDGQALFALSFWFGIGSLILGKHRGKSGWLYFFAGFFVGLIVGFLLSFIIGFMS